MAYMSIVLLSKMLYTFTEHSPLVSIFMAWISARNFKIRVLFKGTWNTSSLFRVSLRVQIKSVMQSTLASLYKKKDEWKSVLHYTQTFKDVLYLDVKHNNSLRCGEKYRIQILPLRINTLIGATEPLSVTSFLNFPSLCPHINCARLAFWRKESDDH